MPPGHDLPPPNHPRQAAPSVCAVVVNYNGGERLHNTLRALREQDYPLEAILLMDNASTDGSPEQVRAQFPAVRIIDLGGNLGPAVARSEGLRQAQADLVLLLDSDVYVQPDTIGKMLEAYRREGEPAVVCPRVRLLPERNTVQTDGADAHFLTMMVLRHAYRPLNDLPTTPAEVGGAISACLLVDRRRTLDAGAFNELFTIYQEDLEFSMRMRVLGHRFVCDPAAQVLHDRGTLAGLTFRGQGTYPARRAYLSMRHRLATMLIHWKLRSLIVMLPVLGLYEAASIGLCVMRGFTGEYFRAWKWTISHWGTIAEHRRFVQRHRVLTDRALYIGGPIPLTPGLIRKQPAAALVATLSAVMNAYWRVARHLIG